jgi:hypothetical protein
MSKRKSEVLNTNKQQMIINDIYERVINSIITNEYISDKCILELIPFVSNSDILIKLISYICYFVKIPTEYTLHALKQLLQLCTDSTIINICEGYSLLALNILSKSETKTDDWIIKIMEILLDNGADVNYNGNNGLTILMILSDNIKYYNIIMWLLKRTKQYNIDLNKVSLHNQFVIYNNVQAIDYVIERNLPIKILHEYFKQGASLTTISHQIPLILRAIRVDNINALLILLLYGGDLYERYNDKSLVAWAIALNKEQIVNLLILTGYINLINFTPIPYLSIESNKLQQIILNKSEWIKKNISTITEKILHGNINIGIRALLIIIRYIPVLDLLYLKARIIEMYQDIRKAYIISSAHNEEYEIRLYSLFQVPSPITALIFEYLVPRKQVREYIFVLNKLFGYIDDNLKIDNERKILHQLTKYSIGVELYNMYNKAIY